MLFFKIFSVAIAIFTIVVLLRPFISEHYSSRHSQKNEQDLITATSITKEDAHYYFLLGILYHYSSDKLDISKAIDSYLYSLKRNPTDSNVWINLARSYRENGMNENASYAARKAVFLDKNNPNIIWDAGVLYLSIDQFPEAVNLFRRYIYINPSEQYKVYSLCHQMRVDAVYIIDNLLPSEISFYREYLNFLMNNKLYTESAEAWDRMKTFNPERKDYIKYCDFMLEAGELDNAKTVWNDFLKRFNMTEPDKHLTNHLNVIWNGDFNLPIEKGCFDWRIGKAEGVKIFIDKDIKLSGAASLSAQFDGKHNPDIYLARQKVIVEPGQKYKASVSIKTDKITTQNGIILEVANHKCGNFFRKTSPVTGTNVWKTLEIEFIIPIDCNIVNLGIKREKSDKFDNKIDGDVWIDSISMTMIRD